MMRKKKSFNNLVVYIIGPMESDPQADKTFGKTERDLINAGVGKVINPCKQEKDKVGMNVAAGQALISEYRKLNQDNTVDDIYDKIWEVDTVNVKEADILVAHLKPGLPFTGTTVEAVLANIPNFIKYTKTKMPVFQYVLYMLIVKPWLILNGWRKPVYLLTPAKLKINGTFLYKLVRGSGGAVFRDSKSLVKHLKERYR